MRRFRLHAFGFLMYLVLALLKVALVNFTLNEYMIEWRQRVANASTGMRVELRSKTRVCSR